MLKLLSVTATAYVVIFAATLASPVSAAQINVNTGHINSFRGGEIGSSYADFARTEPNLAVPKTPKQRKWVCGPIVNYDGTPHCHWGL